MIARYRRRRSWFVWIGQNQVATESDSPRLGKVREFPDGEPWISDSGLGNQAVLQSKQSGLNEARSLNVYVCDVWNRFAACYIRCLSLINIDQSNG